MSALGLAAGTVFGFENGLPPLRDHDLGQSPREAIEGVIRSALQRPPCVVSFSGGRDSSAVLAIAAHIARRDGLPLPVPVTLRFPDCETSLETEWQELVVSHLNLPEWHRLEFHDELDLVGPVSREVLIDHGLLWPFNAYFHVPIFRAATGGSALTGVGGDEIFSAGWAWHRENLVATGRARPLPLDLVRLPISVGPARLRLAFLRKRYARVRHETPWLRPEAQQEILGLRLRASSRESLSWRHSVSRFWWPLSSRFVGARALDRLALGSDVAVSSPLCDPAFLASIVRDRGWRMFADRTAAMRWFVGDLLPENLLARPTKAFFDGAFWNRHSRQFAREWDGSGLDESIVDVDALRRMWSGAGAEPPDARTFSLLQSAWLASTGRQSAREAL